MGQPHEPRQPSEGDLRVYHIINPPASPVHESVMSPDEAVEWIETQAARDLLNPRVESNVFGLEVFEDGEWTEWYDDEGRDIDEYAEEYGAD
jgi:hypothetical protein